MWASESSWAVTAVIPAMTPKMDRIARTLRVLAIGICILPSGWWVVKGLPWGLYSESWVFCNARDDA